MVSPSEVIIITFVIKGDKQMYMTVTPYVLQKASLNLSETINIFQFKNQS